MRLLGSDTSVPAGLALAAGLGVVLFARSRQRHRPALAPGSNVQAVPWDGPPTRLSIRVTGTQPTRTLRIEPHHGATTTNEGA